MKLLFLFVGLFTGMTLAQVRIYKVVVKGVSNGAVITFKNFGSDSVDVSNYYVGSDNRHIPLRPTLTNVNEVSGTGPVIPPGGTWTLDYAPWASNSGSTGKLSQSSDVALWKNNLYTGYGSEFNMVDFMQYCNGGPIDDPTPTACPDYGEYYLASVVGLWEEGTHVTYRGSQRTLTFTGGLNDRGAGYWSYVSTVPTPSPTSSPVTATPGTTSGTTRPVTTTTTSGTTTTRPVTTSTTRPVTTTTTSGTTTTRPATTTTTGTTRTTAGTTEPPDRTTASISCKQITQLIQQALLRLVWVEELLQCDPV